IPREEFARSAEHRRLPHGLDVGLPTRAEAAAAFERDGPAAKPVRDALVVRALEVARADGRPVHFHRGGGDPAVLPGRASPQALSPLIAAHPGQPIVLVHSGWPWVEEAAYISSVQPHVHLDVSILTPWASLALDRKLEAVLGIAPPAKVMHGS